MAIALAEISSLTKQRDRLSQRVKELSNKLEASTVATKVGGCNVGCKLLACLSCEGKSSQRS